MENLIEHPSGAGKVGIGPSFPTKFLQKLLNIVGFDLIDWPASEVALQGSQSVFVALLGGGSMKDLSVLLDAPFADYGSIVEVFTDLTLWFGIKKVIDQINANAIAA